MRTSETRDTSGSSNATAFARNRGYGELAQHLERLSPSERIAFVREKALASVGRHDFADHISVYARVLIMAVQDETARPIAHRTSSETDREYSARMESFNRIQRDIAATEAKWLLQFLPKQGKKLSELYEYLVCTIADGWSVVGEARARVYMKELIYIAKANERNGKLVVEAIRTVDSNASLRSLALSMRQVFVEAMDETNESLEALHRTLAHALVRAATPAQLQTLAAQFYEA